MASAETDPGADRAQPDRRAQRDQPPAEASRRQAFGDRAEQAAAGQHGEQHADRDRGPRARDPRQDRQGLGQTDQDRGAGVERTLVSGPDMADYLAERGRRVEIFHKWNGIGAQIDRYSMGAVMARLAERDVVVHAGWRLAAVGDGKLEFTSAFGGGRRSFEGFDSAVLVYGSVPDAKLYYELKEQGTPARLFLVGSAWVPRPLAEATAHGARVGMEI